MSSLALLEAIKPSPLYVTGKNYLDVILVLMVADDAFPLCMDVVDKKRTKEGQKEDKRRTKGGQKEDKRRTKGGQKEDKMRTK